MEYAAGRPCAAGGYAGYHTGCHEKLHAHAAAGLGHIQPHCRKVAIELLCRLQKSQRNEHPKKYAALSGGKRAAVADELADRGVERSQKPYV